MSGLTHIKELDNLVMDGRGNLVLPRNAEESYRVFKRTHRIRLFTKDEMDSIERIARQYVLDTKSLSIIHNLGLWGTKLTS